MSKTPEEKRAKMIRKMQKMSPQELRHKLKDKKFVRKLEKAGIPAR